MENEKVIPVLEFLRLMFRNRKDFEYQMAIRDYLKKNQDNYKLEDFYSLIMCNIGYIQLADAQEPKFI